MSFRALASEVRRFVVYGMVANPASPIAAGCTLLALGALLEFSRPLNHDVGWLLVATGSWLDGARIYEDVVVEWNPPLILATFAPAVAFARAFDLSEIATFRVAILAVAAFSIGLCDRILACADIGSVILRRYVGATLAFAFAVWIGADFGQREHLVAMLLAPYLAAVAARCGGAALPTRWALLAGVSGGIGAFLKPQYVGVIAALELLLVLRLRSAGSLLRAEVIAFIAVGALYGLSVAIWIPGYAAIVLPLALDGYWAYQRPLAELITLPGLIVLALVIGTSALLRRLPDQRALGGVLALATLGAYAAMLVQGTGWRYSRFPYETCAWVLAMVCLGGWWSRGRGLPDASAAFRTAGATAGVGLLLAGLLAMPPVATTLGRGAIWRSGGTAGGVRLLVEQIDARASGRAVYFLSVGVAGAFPALNYSHARWGSRFSCLWPLAAVVRARAGDPRAPTRLDPERVDAMERYLRDSVASDLEANAPELIFVDLRRRHAFFGTAEVDILGFFLSEPRFARIFARYRRAEPVGFYDLYERTAAAGDPRP